MMSLLKCRPAPVPLLLLTLLLAASAHGANKVPIVTNTSGLGFGKFVAGTGGTITVSTLGQASKTGGVVLLPGGGVSAAAFGLSESGTGTSLSFTTITLPTTVIMTSGANSMTVSSFVSDPNKTMLGSGKTTVLVGATLTVSPNQPPGSYSASFDVTVNYQ